MYHAFRHSTHCVEICGYAPRTRGGIAKFGELRTNIFPPPRNRPTVSSAGDLIFASIGHLERRLKAALTPNQPPPRHVLFDADSVSFIDPSVCDGLRDAIEELQSQDFTFAFARVRDDVANGCGWGASRLPRVRPTSTSA
jgi:MFS superfamily sulfate permease-like transporter